MFTRKTVQISGNDAGNSFISKCRRAAQYLYLLLIVVLKLGGDNAVEFVERNLRLQRFCRLHENFTAHECDFMDHDNFTYVKVLLTATILRSMVGGPSLFLTAVFSMMIDKTDFEARPMRLGRAVNVIIVGRSTGLATGLVYQDLPFWTLFVALLYYILVMFVATKFLKEVAPEFEGRVPPRCRNSCADFLHPKNASDLVLVAFKKRPGRRRVHLLLIFFVTFFLLCSPPSFLPEWETTYLGWDSLQVIIVSAAFIIGGQIFTLVVLRATERSPILDCLLAATSEGMTAIQDLLLAAVTRPDLSGIVYGAMVFSLSHNLGEVGIRLALTKIGGESEIGRLFGILALQETAMTWAKDVAFRSFWDATRDNLPTSQHVLSASFALLNSTVLFGVFFSQRNLASRGREEGREFVVDGNIKTEASKVAVKSAQGCDNTSFEKDCRF
ncbi:uncharacterized protein LOC135200366 isoform X2 [Macrobrachium nipponense]|uniref:uncharacterized protein LOC135200366 isoform X2 n=1 Tax=Macrobrachium nipponense TaxID=159736 RepID=UPI0030C86CD2